MMHCHFAFVLIYDIVYMYICHACIRGFYVCVLIPITLAHLLTAVVHIVHPGYGYIVFPLRSHINQRLSPSRNACLAKSRWCREHSNLLGLTNGAGLTMINHQICFLPHLCEG